VVESQPSHKVQSPLLFMRQFKMNSPVQQLHVLFLQAILRSFAEISSENAKAIIEITPSTQEKFGHYQFNSAMRLSKILKKSPREIAEKISSNVHKESVIKTLEIAGPGFINITLENSYLSQVVDKIAKSPHLGVSLPLKKERIVIDFSGPNIAKELHVGHLRSTIIGDCLARLFEFLGNDVLRLNHLGDWGTQFGMLIAFLKEEEPEVLTGQKKADLSQLQSWYKASKARFDENSSFKEKSQKEVALLQGGDSISLQAWRIICEISKRGYQEIYQLLDVKIEDRGESFYNPFLAPLIDELEKKGILIQSEGAKCIFLEGFVNRENKPLPLILQKSDGGFPYAATDLASLKHRLTVEKADRLIYVTDAGQSQHFKMIFSAAEKAGILDPNKIRVDHVPFGLVLGPDGKKFKTRSGETEKLIDLLQKAVEKARTIIEERNTNIEVEEKNILAEKLGIGSVKYADLSCHRTGDYTFSYDRMLRFEGNTAAYLMYSYVRIQSIKRKVGIKNKDLLESSNASLEHPSEIALGLHLAQFGEVLDQMSIDLLPNRLTEYLYLLADKFNAFFRDCHVEGSKEQNARLILCEACALVLRQGLNILGLQTVEKM
jgi:arginyl-tRNA synthetase